MSIINEIMKKVWKIQDPENNDSFIEVKEIRIHPETLLLVVDDIDYKSYCVDDNKGNYTLCGIPLIIDTSIKSYEVVITDPIQ